MSKLVRLKPFNPKKGYNMRSYTLKGIQIREENGWHEVPDDVADQFANIHADPENADTPFAFDVMSRDEAISFEQKEKRAQQERASASDPIRVRTVRPVDDTTDAADRTHYGRPVNVPNRARTHRARPDESDESRSYEALTGEKGRAEAGPTDLSDDGEYDLAVADLSAQVAKEQGVRAAEQAPFLDGSRISAEVGEVDPRNPDPRNIGERARGAYDDTPFVDGSRDAVVGPTLDPRNPDPRNIGRRAEGAYDDTPFVDGSRDAVVAPFSPPKTPDDEAQMQDTDGTTPPRADVAPVAIPGAPAKPAKPPSRTRRSPA